MSLNLSRRYCQGATLYDIWRCVLACVLSQSNGGGDRSNPAGRIMVACEIWVEKAVDLSLEILSRSRIEVAFPLVGTQAQREEV